VAVYFLQYIFFTEVKAMRIKQTLPAALLTVAALWLNSITVHATPFVPANEAEVVDQLPGNAGKAAAAESVRESRRAQVVLNQNKNNLNLALHVAKLNIRRARTESDPRYLGQAGAALTPWLNVAPPSRPPVTVLVLRANIRQSLHQFGHARADLEEVVAREPGNAQAWLTLATVAQVTGDIATARASCNKLTTLVAPPVHAACVAAIDGNSGNAKAAAASLVRSLQLSPSINRDLRAWITTLQAELTERAGQNVTAEKFYRQALALDKRDAYTVAAYADYLLDQNRAREVLQLIPAETDTDILLLRRVIAAHSLKRADTPEMADKLAARYDAARARGDQLHLREEARFLLHVRRQPAEALKLASKNWQVQKEPADLRILLEAANAAKQRAEAQIALTWLDDIKLEGRELARLAAQARQL
jgi:Tfp pilus assembly protein PilF